MNVRIKKEWILFGIGLCILTFGGRLLLLANIGLGGIDALVVGLSKLFGGSLGLWIDVVSIMLVIVGALFRKGKLQWGPIFTSLLLGLLYDIWGSILFNRLESPKDAFIQGLVFLAGILIAPLGSAIYIYAHISTSCVDYLMLSVRERFHLSMGTSRIVIEVTFVIAAYLVGGPIGKGTIMIMLLFGMVLQTYYKVVEQILKKKLCMNKMKNKRKTI